MRFWDDLIVNLSPFKRFLKQKELSRGNLEHKRDSKRDTNQAVLGTDVYTEFCSTKTCTITEMFGKHC